MGAGLGLKSFEKTCTASAVAEALGTGYAPANTRLQAISTNTGDVYLGGPDVTAENGYLIPEPAANSYVTLSDLISSGYTEDFDLSRVYIVTTVNAEGVRVLQQVR